MSADVAMHIRVLDPIRTTSRQKRLPLGKPLLGPIKCEATNEHAHNRLQRHLPTEGDTSMLAAGVLTCESTYSPTFPPQSGSGIPDFVLTYSSGGCPGIAPDSQITMRDTRAHDTVNNFEILSSFSIDVPLPSGKGIIQQPLGQGADDRCKLCGLPLPRECQGALPPAAR